MLNLAVALIMNDEFNYKPLCKSHTVGEITPEQGSGHALDLLWAAPLSLHIVIDTMDIDRKLGSVCDVCVLIKSDWVYPEIFGFLTELMLNVTWQGRNVLCHGLGKKADVANLAFLFQTDSTGSL